VDESDHAIDQPRGRGGVVFDADLARAAVALILEGQEPPFEGRG
jgi:hypothetical protein